MSWKLVQQICLGISALLFFATATIGFNWVHSPYLLGYILAAAGFFYLSLMAASIET